MPSTLIIAIETAEGPGPNPGRRDLHTIEIPDAHPTAGEGSRVQAELIAAHAAGLIMREASTADLPAI